MIEVRSYGSEQVEPKRTDSGRRSGEGSEPSAAAAPERTQSGGEQRHQPEPTKLFVGGLSWQCTEETLRHAFGAVGEVTKAMIMVTRDEPPKSRGFGFVHVRCLPLVLAPFIC